MKNKAKVLGMIKVWQQRLATYLSLINFVMIFYLYIIESPLGLKWYHWLPIIVIGVVSVLYVDVKYIFPNTQLYTFKKNPGMVMLKEMIEENSDKLEEILKLTKDLKDKDILSDTEIE